MGLGLGWVSFWFLRWISIKTRMNMVVTGPKAARHGYLLHCVLCLTYLTWLLERVVNFEGTIVVWKLTIVLLLFVVKRFYRSGHATIINSWVKLWRFALLLNRSQNVDRKPSRHSWSKHSLRLLHDFDRAHILAVVYVHNSISITMLVQKKGGITGRPAFMMQQEW